MRLAAALLLLIHMHAVSAAQSNPAGDAPAVEPVVEPVEPAGQPANPLAWQTQAKEVLGVISEGNTSTAKRAEIYKELMELKPATAEDPRFQQAYALLAMYQKKQADALSLTEQIADSAPQYIPAMALRARVLLLTEKRTAGLAQLQALASSLAQSPANPAADVTATQLDSAARFLGLAIGFFNGPGRDSIRPTALAELVAAADKLPVELKIAYESSRLAIEEEYRVLTEEGEEALKALRDGLEKEAAAMREQLEKQRAKAADQSEYTRLELQTNFNNLSTQWQNTWNASQTLTQQADAMVARNIALQASLGVIPPPLTDSQGRVDPNDQQRYLFEVGRLQNAITNANFQVAAVAAQLNRVNNQGMLIERQMQVAQARAQQLGMNLAMQNQSFAQLDAAIKQKELAATKAEPKKKTNAQLRRERSFMTYDDFNVHKEKLLLTEAIDLPASIK